MSEITLRIGGKSYKVACADGEEAHLSNLGSMIDDKLKAMGSNAGATEAQNLLFAGLFLADELHDARAASGNVSAEETHDVKALEEKVEVAEKKQRELSLELDVLQAERDAIANDLANARAGAPAQVTHAESDDVAQKLEQLAQSIEKCADSLESRASAP